MSPRGIVTFEHLYSVLLLFGIAMAKMRSRPSAFGTLIFQEVDVSGRTLGVGGSHGNKASSGRAFDDSETHFTNEATAFLDIRPLFWTSVSALKGSLADLQ